MGNRLAMGTWALALLFALGTRAQQLGPRDGFSWDKQRVALPSGTTLEFIGTEPSQGIPLLLLHGYTDSSRSF